jgi:hypothetical protein
MNARRAAALLVCLLATTVAGVAQPRVNPRHMYERMMAIVPIVGQGTPDDPKRPMYAPVAHAATATVGINATNGTSATARTGILGFTYVLSDDGKFALVEFVARDRSAFQSVLADAALPAASVKAFVKGMHQRQDVETAFKALKKDFDFEKFGVRMP